LKSIIPSVEKMAKTATITIAALVTTPAVALLEHEDEHAIGGSDGEQVEQDRLERDDDRAERDEQQHKRETEHERAGRAGSGSEHERQPAEHRDPAVGRAPVPCAGGEVGVLHDDDPPTCGVAVHR
jgi:hypothetical protein